MHVVNVSQALSASIDPVSGVHLMGVALLIGIVLIVACAMLSGRGGYR